jgi:hypothetical protein
VARWLTHGDLRRTEREIGDDRHVAAVAEIEARFA